MTQSILVNHSLSTEICSGCGIMFAISTQWMDVLRQNGETFYCPNGHMQHYTKTLQEELKAAKTELFYEKDAHQFDLKKIAKLQKKIAKLEATKVVDSGILEPEGEQSEKAE